MSPCAAVEFVVASVKVVLVYLCQSFFVIGFSVVLLMIMYSFAALKKKFSSDFCNRCLGSSNSCFCLVSFSFRFGSLSSGT